MVQHMAGVFIKNTICAFVVLSASRCVTPKIIDIIKSHEVLANAMEKLLSGLFIDLNMLFNMLFKCNLFNV